MALALMTGFADWLDSELRQRSLNRSQLAAYIATSPSVVGAWFTDDRQPSTDMCVRIARLWRVPLDFVLKKAGHIPADYEVEEPRIPGWLITVFEPEDPAQQLDPYELQVLEHTVVETARGLIQLREERARYGATPATPDEPPPAS